MKNWQRTFLMAGDAVPWWLSGGISAANCIAAYQPKGAASLAASYVNLANRGTYDAAPGVAPAWNASTGWTGNGSSTYLTTGIVPGASWSMLVRFSDVSGAIGSALGIFRPATLERFYLWPRFSVSNHLCGYGSGFGLFKPELASGVMALSANIPYLDGNAETTIAGTWNATTDQIFILCVNESGNPTTYIVGNILAVAIYDTALDSAQIAAITTAMQGL